MPYVEVARRLDEGQAAVDTIAEYVWACHLLGFTHPDLTQYRYQVQDWYAAEDGLDLRVLDAQCHSLVATAAAAEQALRLQDNHFRDLSQAWQGAGGAASTAFLAGHAASAGQVVVGIRSAAATLARLRDELWRAVDAKVSATVQIEARPAGQRGVWLAAARTVNTGVGDRAAASELIDAQVKPFVANDIAGDWLTAMRGATRAVADAYADAIAALRAEPLPVFAIPGELGPVRSSIGPQPGAGAMAASSTFPAASVSAPAPAGASPWPVPTAGGAAAPMAAPLAPATPAAEPGLSAPAPVEPMDPTPAPLSGLGSGLAGGGLPGLGGLSDIGSGLAGTGQELGDLFGGLLGSAADGVPDDFGDLSDGVDSDSGADIGQDNDSDPSADTESEDDETDDELDEEADDEEDGAEDPDGEPGEPVDSAEVTEPQPQSPLPVAEEPAPISPPPAVSEPVAEPLAAPAGETPCEIAADELPQAGP